MTGIDIKAKRTVLLMAADRVNLIRQLDGNWPARRTRTPVVRPPSCVLHQKTRITGTSRKTTKKMNIGARNAHPVNSRPDPPQPSQPPVLLRAQPVPPPYGGGLHNGQ